MNYSKNWKRNSRKIGRAFFLASLIFLLPGKSVGDTNWQWENVPKYEEHKDFPAEKEKAWSKEQHLEKRHALSQFIRDLKSQAPDTIKALPAAADFPGVPADGTKIVTRTINIDPNIPRWQSTGLYALPGTIVTVKFPAGTPLQSENGKNRYELRVGLHRDILSDSQDNWFRSPDLCFTRPVQDHTATICSPFGGPFMISIPEGRTMKGKPVRVEVSGVVPMPEYVLGKTTGESWKKTLANTTTPWGEIKTPRITVTLPLEYLKKIPDIEALAKHVQKGMEVQEWLAGWDQLPQRKKSPMRFAVDRQISHGYGHAGYPAHGIYAWTKPMVDGTMPTKGDWGFWHEMGHNHQFPPYLMKGMTEITVNLFSLVVQNKLLGVPLDKGWGNFSSNKFRKSLDEYFHNDKRYRSLNREYDIRLYFFVDFIREFGYEPFRQISLEFNKNPYTPIIDTEVANWSWNDKTYNDQEQWDWLFVQMCEAVKKDLSPYFKVWKVDISESAIKKAAKYPTWLPAPDYPAQYRQEVDKPS